MMQHSLVSVMIPNYNYARFLGQCLDSVLNQTYDNFEVIISDNHSADDSYELIRKYSDRFEKRGIWFDYLRNKRNIGAGGNSEKCLARSEGKYIMWLSSDDFLEPTALESMAKSMELYPNAGYVMVHRNEVNENGKITKTVPFYNQSCMIKGEAQAAVDMVAGVAVPSQIMFRSGTYHQMLQSKHLRFQVAGDWYDNFLMACHGDVLYIKDALVNYRVHSANESSESERSLVGIFEHYQLINAFANLSKAYGLKKPLARYDEAVEKLGSMCLRYAMKMFQNNLNDTALRYLLLAPVFKRDIGSDRTYQQLMHCVDLSGGALGNALDEILQENPLKRTISYAPPEDSMEIDI